LVSLRNHVLHTVLIWFSLAGFLGEYNVVFTIAVRLVAVTDVGCGKVFSVGHVN